MLENPAPDGYHRGMNDPIQFAKLCGSGNDFVCIDARDGRFDAMLGSPERLCSLVRAMCRRGVGVGADGVIFAIAPEIEGVADIAARFFEADGSEVELCGNGTACFAAWMFANGWAGTDPAEDFRILTTAGVIRASKCEGQYIRVCIPTPEQLQRDVEVSLTGVPWWCDFAVVGVRHVVSYVDDVASIDLARLGPALRHHDRFAPRGVNANFAQIVGKGRIILRTWEFGVEGETLACGTGSAAAAVLSAIRFGWPAEFLNGERPVEVTARSGDVLRVFFSMTDDGQVDDICLETTVRFIYSAVLGDEFARILNGDQPTR